MQYLAVKKTNIINDYNGFLCEDTIASLKDKITLLALNKTLAKEMGKNAYEYYTEKCTIGNMANGFINAIESN